MESNEKSLWQVIKGYFNALPDKENEEETIQQISSGVAFHGSNLWVLVFAVFIASLGLNVNSTAVIIGAMLISPLMGPIIGMGFGVGINDLVLLKRSIKNYLVATGISVLTATLYDVLIALCGGAAGILALSTKGKGNVIPGVAIATALMPPLCTAGYGLAMGESSFFFGAFYLFFINTVFIALATFIGVRMLRFKQRRFIDDARLRKMKQYIIGIVVLTMLPAAYMTLQIIRQSVIENNARRFVRTELSFKGTRISSQNYDTKDKVLNVVAVGETISKKAICEAEKMLEAYNLADYKLHVIQGSQSDSLLMANQMLGTGTTSEQVSKQKLIEQSAQINDLEQKLEKFTRYTELTKDVREELKSMYPTAKLVAIAQIPGTKTDTVVTKSHVMAVVSCLRPLNNPDRERLQSWLKLRTKSDSLKLIVTQN